MNAREGVFVLLAGAIFCASGLSCRRDTPTVSRGLTEQKCRRWAERIEKSINAGDAGLLNQSLDIQALMAKASAGLELAAKDKAEFLNGLRPMRERFGQEVCRSLGDFGTYKCLRIRRGDGQYHALFRKTGEGVNYHDLHLSADRAGKVCIRDAYLYLAGENLSDLCRRLLIQVLKQSRDRPGLPNEWFQALPAVEAMHAHFRHQRWAEYLKAYETLPAPVRKEKGILVQRLMVARNVSEEAYGQALADFIKTCPADPTADLHSLTWYKTTGRFNEAHKAVDRLEKRMDHDPYLKVLRANVCMLQADPARARSLLEQAAREEPDLPETYWKMVEAAAAQKDYPAAVRALRTLVADLKRALPDLNNDPAMGDFLQSDAYAEWAAAQGPGGQ